MFARVRSFAARSVAGLALFLVVGNLLIVTAWVVASATTAVPTMPTLPGIANLAAVDERVWRGAAPSTEGYRALAEHGVTTIVDIRAESDIHVPRTLLAGLGMDHVAIPMRDGQAPTANQVQAFLNTVRRSSERVFVHCGAGVGRTSTMAAAYLVKTGQASNFQAVRRNLAIGPPSLEQLAFAARLNDDATGSAGGVLTVISRVLDAPRRIWVKVTLAYA
jgi:hypothetical protein